MKYLIIIIILVGILLYGYKIYGTKILEQFDHNGYSGKIALRPYINVGKHVRISKQNTVESISMKKPLPRTGENSCNETKCPNYLSGDVYCWKCE
jgi:hypothetical protein